MKKYITVALLLLSLTGCTTQTKYGYCIGINGHRDENLIYEYNALNIFWAVLFSETIIIPIIVVLDNLECPVGVKNGK